MGDLQVTPFAAGLGADVSGIDLASLDDAGFDAVHAAFLAHKVLRFRDQELPPAAQLAFARRFGAPEVHPIVEGTEDHPDVIRVFKPAGASASFGVGWHSDNSFFVEPSLGTVLYGVTIPPVGGDTLFANTEMAWEALSAPLQSALRDAVAVHSAREAYDPVLVGREKYDGDGPLKYRESDIIGEEVRHPLVRSHPETGRLGLYVNPMFTLRIAGYRRNESRALLDFLFAHVVQPEFTCRFGWQPGTVALWDNRCVWHYAMDDYAAHERLMYRVTIQGDRPR